MSSPRSLTITRAFEAAPDRVFELWIDPKLVSRWWGVAGSTVPVCELDVRVGGRWRIEMKTASGKTYPNGGKYLEVVPSKRLVYSDEPDASIQEWNGSPPGTSTHTVTFEGQGQSTLVTLEIEFGSDADRERLIGFGMKDGIEQSLDRLQQLIADLANADP